MSDELGPFPASTVHARLETIAAIKFVGTATDLNTALKESPPVTPAVYVVVQEQGDEPMGFSGGTFAQNVTVAVQLVVMVGNYIGKAGVTHLDTVIRPAIRAAIIGWSPSPSFKKCSLQGSRQERFVAPNLVAQEIYRTEYTIRRSL